MQGEPRGGGGASGRLGTPEQGGGGLEREHAQSRARADQGKRAAALGGQLQVGAGVTDPVFLRAEYFSKRENLIL